MILTDIERRAVRLRLHSFLSYLKLTKITKKISRDLRGERGPGHPPLRATACFLTDSGYFRRCAATVSDSVDSS